MLAARRAFEAATQPRVAIDHTTVMNLRNGNSSSKALSPDPPERGGDTGDPGNAISDELNPTRLRRRLLELAAVGVLAGVVVLTGPGLGDLRAQLARASPGSLLLGVGMEALGVLVLGYLIGQLGGNLPVPGGIGGVDAD